MPRPFGITTIGTQVRLPDGRLATVVFNGLCGVGCKLGLHDPPPEDFEGTFGDIGPAARELPEDWPWKPDVLLRDPFPGCEALGLPCVGDEALCEVLRVGLGQ
ncbi:MAG: hypothetical protein JRI66_09110 [Deltaproteobacteria bacterium]|nr:hypothetical protein [Deltaproteobacteria bacterium]